MTSTAQVKVVVGAHVQPADQARWDQVRRLVRDQVATKELIKMAEVEAKERQALLEMELAAWREAYPQATHFLIDIGETVVQFQQVRPSPRRELSAEKLLGLGVSPAVLEAATIEKPVNPYTRLDLVQEREVQQLRAEGRL